MMSQRRAVPHRCEPFRDGSAPLLRRVIVSMAAIQWDPIDAKAVDTVRVLAADAVEKVGNGHPGTAMSLAPLAYLLFQRVMRRDPSDSTWIGRDRFILSAGHSLADPVHPVLSRRLRPRARKTSRSFAPGVRRPRGTRSTGTPTASRSPRGHSVPGLRRPSVSRTPPASSAACSIRTRNPARAPSTTSST